MAPLAAVRLLVLVAMQAIFCNSATDWTRAITYNTALIPSDLVVGYAERLGALTHSFRTDKVWQQADVVCLQEVVSFEDRQSLADAAKAAGLVYSYNDSLAVPSPELPACSATQLVKISRCALAQRCIPGATLQGTINCLVVKCKEVLLELLSAEEGQTCINCITQVKNLATQLDSCYSTPRKNFKTDLSLLLLSRKPQKHTSIHTFTSQANFYRRGYLKAEIDDIGVVLCTHLYPRAEGQIYIGNFSSFQGHNAQNAAKLLNVLSGKRGFILGDLNSGPSLPNRNVHALFPENFQIYLRDGALYSPYVPEDGRCTFCEGNVLLSLSGVPQGERMNQTLDHILLRNDTYRVRNVTRLFDQPDAVSLGPGKQRVPMSDHYAVQVEFQRSSASQTGLLVIVFMVAIAHLLLTSLCIMQ